MWHATKRGDRWSLVGFRMTNRPAHLRHFTARIEGSAPGAGHSPLRWCSVLWLPADAQDRPYRLHEVVEHPEHRVRELDDPVDGPAPLGSLVASLRAEFA